MMEDAALRDSSVKSEATQSTHPVSVTDAIWMARPISLLFCNLFSMRAALLGLPVGSMMTAASPMSNGEQSLPRVCSGGRDLCVAGISNRTEEDSAAISYSFQIVGSVASVQAALSILS